MAYRETESYVPPEEEDRHLADWSAQFKHLEGIRKYVADGGIIVAWINEARKSLLTLPAEVTNSDSYRSIRDDLDDAEQNARDQLKHKIDLTARLLIKRIENTGLAQENAELKRQIAVLNGDQERAEDWEQLVRDYDRVLAAIALAESTYPNALGDSLKSKSEL